MMKDRKLKISVSSITVLVFIIASIISMPSAYAVNTLIYDSFEENNLNNWADFGTNTSPPSLTNVTTYNPINGTYSLYSEDNIGFQDSDFWLNNSWTQHSDFNVTFYVRVINNTNTDLFQVNIIPNTMFYGNAASFFINTGDQNNVTLYLITQNFAFTYTNESKINFHDLYGRVNKFTYHIIMNATYSFVDLLINNTSIASYTPAQPFNESFSNAEFFHLNGSMDDFSVTYPAGTFTTITTTITTTFTNTQYTTSTSVHITYSIINTTFTCCTTTVTTSTTTVTVPAGTITTTTTTTSITTQTRLIIIFKQG